MNHRSSLRTESSHSLCIPTKIMHQVLMKHLRWFQKPSKSYQTQRNDRPMIDMVPTRTHDPLESRLTRHSEVVQERGRISPTTMESIQTSCLECFLEADSIILACSSAGGLRCFNSVVVILRFVGDRLKGCGLKIKDSAETKIVIKTNPKCEHPPLGSVFFRSSYSSWSLSSNHFLLSSLPPQSLILPYLGLPTRSIPSKESPMVHQVLHTM